MSRMMPLGLLLLALLAGSASAGRQTRWERVQSATLQLENDLVGRRGGGEKTFVVGIKHNVPPSMQTDFIDAWRKLQDEAVKEKAMTMYDLAKTSHDNAYFWIYGEWESRKDFFDHLDNDYTQKFLDFLDDNDIKYEMFPLESVAEETKKERRTELVESALNRRGKGGEDPRKGRFRINVHYHVPPSVTTDFVDAWMDIAGRTWDEKDNIHYSLHKVGTMNHHFIACGSWESFDAFLDHHTSKHMRKMRDYMADNDIEFYSEPIIYLGDSDKTDY